MLVLLAACTGLLVQDPPMTADHRADADVRPRARDLGIRPGVLPPGPLNAITDVAGVRVGQVTLVEGEAVRTGVTAILPHGGNPYQEPVPAAVYVGNGFGKAAGFLQVQELGRLETPIVLTSTLSVGAAVEGAVRWTLGRPGNERVRSVNAVVGEVNDGRLHDIRGLHVRPEHVVAAIDSARGGPVDEGGTGGGTGAVAFGWKGGIGTASRRLPQALGGYTVGALVQANFGGILTIDGVRVGESLGRHSFSRELRPGGPDDEDDAPDGSCMIVLATDAPLGSRNLERLARRGVLGLARTGSFMSNGSGDFVIAFSTLVEPRGSGPVVTVPRLRNEAMSPLMLAVVESVEEAVYNALLRATTMTGRDGARVEAIPVDRLRELLGR